MHFADALYDQLRRSLLQYNPRATEFHGLYKLVFVFGCSQYNDLCTAAILLQRLQCGKPVKIGHAKIEQQYIGIKLSHYFNHLPSVARLPHHFEIRFQRQKPANAIPYNRVVVRNYDSDVGLFRSRHAEAIFAGGALVRFALFIRKHVIYDRHV